MSIPSGLNTASSGNAQSTLRTEFTDTILGNSGALISMLNSLNLLAGLDVTVLVQGESGTGKELVADYIHLHSVRKKQPLVKVNCAALPENLLEAELFGYRKGAFTGADKDFSGRIRRAHGGTLLLDEVAEIPLNIQAKLLRFLESGECQVLGQPHSEKVDVRLIASSNQDLYQHVQSGAFRADLYYRLNIVPVQVPPLRQRKEDIDVLLAYYLRYFAEQHQLTSAVLSKQALSVLRQYAWPGNVRELRNLCERLTVFFHGREVDQFNLPQEFTRQTAILAGFTLPAEGISLLELEKALLLEALQANQGNQSKAARWLGLSRDTFLYRLRKYCPLKKG